MIETYVLVDPRDGRIRYVGKTTVGVQNRLRQHMATALDYAWYMPGWLAELKRQKKRPRAIVVAPFDNERAVYFALRKRGASLFNSHVPARAVDDPVVKSCTHADCGLADRRAA